MENISLPSTIAIAVDKDDANKGVVTIEPLYPGYGQTVANALRRVLLSSLPGAAIFAFKIKGVKHEFSTLPYIKEDVVDISLNLKRLNLKSFTDEVVKLEIEAKGEKVVTAKDIKANSDIEISNPDFPILTLTDKAASLDMTIWIKAGRGYETVESRPDQELEVNAIAIDAIFSPVRQVGYQVDNIRVGDRTDYDKVIMQIETNGAISAQEALHNSAIILSQHFTLIADNTGAAPVESESESEKE
ncbi:MAG: DNA-directed RNA polymerase subunit alpha [Candidatus Komeilibacteria bacterium]|nr:DNA-directed RNA polymerase subunit alpha [Candidatus Komeilibacteria bacterium]